MKKFVKIAALVFAAGLSATVAGCSGCAGCNSTINDTLTNSNWYTGTSYKGIQPSFIEGRTPFKAEKLTYAVTYDATNAVNSSYSLEYKDGKLTTEFYAKNYDWSNTNIPEGYRGGEAEVVYYYKTELTVSVQYTLKTGDKAQSEWFNDTVVHESYFRAAGKNLQPVYSKQILRATTPANYSAATLDKAYHKVDESYENFYNRGCTEVISIKDGKADEAKTFSLTKLKNTLFDNSSLYNVIRSMRLSTDFSQRISLFNAVVGGVADYVISGSDAALSEQERKDITGQMQKAGLYTPAEENDEGIKAIAANINYAGGDLTGTTQTVWYAAIDNPDFNKSRSTLLKISIPLSFSLGTLNFTLNWDEASDSTLWDK